MDTTSSSVDGATELDRVVLILLNKLSNSKKLQTNGENFEN